MASKKKPATGTPHALTDEELEKAVGGDDIRPNYFKGYPYANS
jgi:hypothetical protein